MTLRLLFLWLHIIGAAVWVGGMIFLTAILVPYSRTLPPEMKREVFHEVGIRFRLVAWSAIALLAATGTGLLWTLPHTWDQIFQTPFWAVFKVKMVLFTAMLLASAPHDFVLGPLQRQAGAAARPQLARLGSWLARLTLLLSLGVLLAAVKLTR